MVKPRWDCESCHRHNWLGYDVVTRNKTPNVMAQYIKTWVLTPLTGLTQTKVWRGSAPHSTQGPRSTVKVLASRRPGFEAHTAKRYMKHRLCSLPRMRHMLLPNSKMVREWGGWKGSWDVHGYLWVLNISAIEFCLTPNLCVLYILRQLYIP